MVRSAAGNSEMKVSFSGSTLVIDDRSVDLDAPIQQAIPRDGLVVVLVKESGQDESDESGGRNIFAVDKTGKEVWRIAFPGWLDKTITGEKIISPWVRLRGDAGSQMLKADDGVGYTYDLDSATGKLSNPVFRK